MSDKNDACKIFLENNYAQTMSKKVVLHGMMISIYSEIFHDFTAKNKINASHILNTCNYDKF